MAKVRIGFSTQFELENELVGIGTDNPTNTLQALGNIHAPNTKAIGISTLTVFDGFIDTKAAISGLEGSEQGAVSDEIVIEGEVTVSTGTTFTSGTENLTVVDNFTLPGVSDDKPTVGTTRFNENLGVLEFYTGSEWRAVSSTVDMGNRGRGLYMNPLDSTGAKTSNVYSLQISTLGNATNFGNLSTAAFMGSACANKTRGFYGRGGTPTKINTIEYVNMASEGDGIDFGDATVTEAGGQAGSSSTRGIFGGGSTPGYTNVIDYIEMATIGNALDFGDLYFNCTGAGTACGNPTRLLFMGGYGPSPLQDRSDIQMITIASKGNAEKFGDLTKSRAHNGSFSSSTRGICGGGTDYDNPHVNIIDYVTIASEGNATEFGSLMQPGLGYIGGAASTETRGVWCGGRTNPANAYTNTIQYVTIATTGNAQDFGDLPESVGMGYGKHCSDSHGGLGGF